jgi:plasmid stabilization system protein ParE
MSRRIVIRSNAEQDIRNGCQWYARQGVGLELRFLEALDEALRQVAAFPESVPQVDAVHRRVLLRTFPYGVYYQLHQERIVVKAILHLAREPATIEERLDE